METDYQNDTVEFTEYEYNVDGIRVSKHTWTEIDNVPQVDDIYTSYLIDAYNNTGYAQALEETVDDGSTPTTTTYTIGDDIITQYNTSTGAEHLMYDGHGSTRQLVDNSGSGIVDTFSYDAYGVMLGGNPTYSSPALTNLLYTGEQFDTHLGRYNLRSRWYDTLTGTFNRMDDYSGNPQDPQSLHKYLYCHANPVNCIDPSGNNLILNFTIQTAIRATIAAALFGAISFTSAKLRGATWGMSLWYGLKTAVITGFAFLSPLFAWSLAIISPFLLALGIASGDITRADIPEIAAYIAAGIILILLFKSPQYKVWETKTAIKTKLPQAIRNLETRSINPARNRMWQEAVRTGNKATKGSLIHAELADLMRKEGMTNLGIEVSYNSAGDIVTYGTKGSVRVDYAIYHRGDVIKVFDIKPSEVISGSRLNKIAQYTQLSAEDIEVMSYGGR